MKALTHLRFIGLVEGLSYLVLLLVAMPLKYAFGLPAAVRIVGSVHGFLFVLFVAALARAAFVHAWPLQRSLAAFVASVVPGGTFVLDGMLKREIAGRPQEASLLG